MTRPEADPATTFPRQQARTQRFTLGAPRNVTVSPDGTRVAFLRSAGPEDARHRRCGCSTSRRARSGSWPIPRALLAGDPADLPPEERVRRERARESAAGITGYATDADHRMVAAAPGRPAGRGRPRRRHRGARAGAERGDRPATRPHRHPGRVGRRPAALGARARRPVVGARARRRGRPRGAMGRGGVRRRRGDGPLPRLLVGAGRRRRCSPPGWTTRPCSGGGSPTPPTPTARRPRSPTRPPARRTPTSPPGSSRLDGTRTEVALGARRPPLPGRGRLGRPRSPPRAAPARPAAHRGPRRRPAVGRHRGAVDRPRRRVGGARAGHARPARRRAGGRLLRRGRPPAARGRRHAGHARRPARARASPTSATTGSCSPPTRSTTPPAPPCGGGRDAGLEQLTADDGVHSAVVGGDTVVVRRVSLDRPRARRSPWSAGRPSPATVATPLVTPNVTIRHVGERRLATALLLPHDAGDATGSRCSLDPYGGPHAQRVVQARVGLPHLAVVRRPGVRGRRDRRARHARAAAPSGSAAIHGDLAGPVLEDQVDGLLALAAEDPRLDLSRVAIRGWSFGGYLAALAVLRRPDVFHAAIAGAPVTDWRLYDTFYTERYLGDPEHGRGALRRQLAPARRPEARAPAAAPARPGRRQRRERPHPAAVGGPPRGRPPAPGAAAHRRHPHGEPGGGRREPPPAPARLPA